MTLRVSCEHGKWEAHQYDGLVQDTIRRHCGGGREPTVEETTQWLTEHGWVAGSQPIAEARMLLRRYE